jgi:hypothetical protein
VIESERRFGLLQMVKHANLFIQAALLSNDSNIGNRVQWYLFAKIVT